MADASGLAELKQLGAKTVPVVSRGDQFVFAQVIKAVVDFLGLKDETGQGSYNPPSLNGLQHQGRFLHDNSAATLSRALELHRPAAMKNLRGAERADLLKFLLSI